MITLITLISAIKKNFPKIQNIPAQQSDRVPPTPTSVFRLLSFSCIRRARLFPAGTAIFDPRLVQSKRSCGDKKAYPEWRLHPDADFAAITSASILTTNGHDSVNNGKSQSPKYFLRYRGNIFLINFEFFNPPSNEFTPGESLCSN